MELFGVMTGNGGSTETASYSVASLRVVVLERRWRADSEQKRREAHQFLQPQGKNQRPRLHVQLSDHVGNCAHITVHSGSPQSNSKGDIMGSRGEEALVLPGWTSISPLPD